MPKGENELLRIEVVYAMPDRQRLLEIEVRAGRTARDAALQSGMNEYFPDLDLQECPLGVFGKVVPDDYHLRDGDRVEIYRELQMNPREARMKAAAAGKTMRGDELPRKTVRG